MTTPPSWLDDPDAPPTAEELAEAAALARALDGDAPPTGALDGRAPPTGARPPHSALPLIEALQAAHHPGDLPRARNDELIVRALADAAPARVLRFPSRPAVARAAVVLAAAACLALVLGRSLRRPDAVPLAASRSSQELFAEPFPREGGGSARVDRVAAVRSRELRDNRFARWGVR